jgi:hypothetical protein
MIGILRECARVFSSYRRWHAGLIGPSVRRAGNDARDARAAAGPAARAASRPATVIDLAGARRLRCLSEPCANTRLTIALLRAQRQLQGHGTGLGTPR